MPRLGDVRLDTAAPTPPERLLDQEGDEPAAIFYRDAVRLGSIGAELVLAHATATDRHDDALRAMHGLLRAGQERVIPTERARALVLGLIDHPD
ncbi:MAG: hypothetical protein MUC36_28370, partial [Planctomycetes bacterium]|nr:hypothetical protein [Planctomycetota bacterium]